MTAHLPLTDVQRARLRDDEAAALHGLNSRLTTASAAGPHGAAWRLRYDQLMAIANGAPTMTDPNRPGHRIPTAKPLPDYEASTSTGIAFDVLTDDRYKDTRTAFRHATRRLERAVGDYRPAVTQFAVAIANGGATREQADELLEARARITRAVAAVDEALATVLDVTGTLRVDACEKATRG